jgi:hypothetical protein
MADLTYSQIATKKQDAVLKALSGSVFIAEYSAAAITTLTVDSIGSPGTPTLNALPAGYLDMGYLSDAGAIIGESVSTADIAAWGEVEPVRRDITSDVTTVHLVGLETRKENLSAFFGVDPTTVTANATTAEVSIPRPSRPATRYYRMLVLAVDGPASAEIYVARFLPRVALSAKGDQTLASSGSLGIEWDSTWTAFTDPVLGYADKFFAGGPGWKPIKTDLGF